MKEPMRMATFTVEHKKSTKDYCIRVVGNKPSLIASHPYFLRKLYEEVFGLKKAVEQMKKESLIIHKIKLHEVTGYTKDNANWGTTK